MQAWRTNVKILHFVDARKTNFQIEKKMHLDWIFQINPELFDLWFEMNAYILVHVPDVNKQGHKYSSSNLLDKSLSKTDKNPVCVSCLPWCEISDLLPYAVGHRRSLVGGRHQEYNIWHSEATWKDMKVAMTRPCGET